MKALIIAPNTDRCTPQDRPDPEPGPGDLLVRVQASGLCAMDVKQLRGDMGDPDRIGGHEFVGEVVRTGSQVSGFAPGDRVGVTWHQRWCRHCPDCVRGRLELCRAADETGIYVDGGHAQYALIDAASAVPVPDSIDSAQAAVLMCSGYVAYSALVDAHAGPQRRIAVVGIGGIGHLAVQYARAMGAEVVAVTSSPDKAELALSLGAHEVVTAGPTEFGQQLKARGWVDGVILTSDHPAAMMSSVDGLAPYGRLAVLAATVEPTPIALQRLLHFKLSLVGSSQGPRNRLGEMLDLHQRSGATAMVEQWPLEEAEVAMKAVQDGRVRFRAVLVP